jgi:hypothetical protein
VKWTIGAAPITPAFGTWAVTTGADRIAGVATRIGSAMTSGPASRQKS